MVNGNRQVTDLDELRQVCGGNNWGVCVYSKQGMDNTILQSDTHFLLW